MTLRPLRLMNSFGTVDQNACFANSIIQVLRRIPNVKETILALPPETTVQSQLQNIFKREGTDSLISSYPLRVALRPDFSRGNQMDSKEFFDALLQALPFLEPLFNFKVKRTFRFINTRYSPACRFCHRVEDQVIQKETSLFLPLYNSSNLVLQNLIDNYLRFEANEKRCSHCPSSPQQTYQVFKDFTDPGLFLIIQLQRFDNNLKKILHFVQGSHLININSFKFKLICIVDHIGAFDQGHYRALLESNGKWYICDDYHLPRHIAKESIFSESNYLYIFEKILPTDEATVTSLIDHELQKPTDTSSQIPPVSTSKPGTKNFESLSKQKSYFEVLNVSSDDSDDSSESRSEPIIQTLIYDPQLHFTQQLATPFPPPVSSDPHVLHSQSQDLSKGYQFKSKKSDLTNLPREISSWFTKKETVPRTKDCFVFLGKKIDEIPKYSRRLNGIENHSKQPIEQEVFSSLADGLEICKGCQKRFKQIRMHLRYSIACKGHYLMSELEEDTNKKRENTRSRVKKHRDALREQNFKAYKEEKRLEKQKERAEKRKIDKEDFDERRRIEKERERAKRRN